MTEDELKQIEEREKAATKGPWEWHDSDPSWLAVREEEGKHGAHFRDGLHVEAVLPCSVAKDYLKRFAEQHEANRAFIAHSRADIPRLLTEVRFLKSQQRELERGTEILVCELEKLREENRRLANENAALIAQIPHGFTFPRDGEARLIE